MIDVKQLINDPSYLAYRFDFSTESVEFIPVSKDELTEATWLAREVFARESGTISVPLLDVVQSVNSYPLSPRKQPCFIFHTAYCASTFLSRCLELKGKSVSLREPQILLDAANAKRLQWRSQTSTLDFRHLPLLAVRLLQKHAEPHETLIIKPVNSVNNIISELVQLAGANKSLMLYTDARSFLLSTLKKGEEAKQRQRAMFDLLRCDFPHLSQLGLSDAIHLSDLKICLTLWRLQIEQAEQALVRYSSQGLMGSLYSENLIKKPKEGLQAANEFLQLGLSTQTIDDIVAGDLITRDAKNSGSLFSLNKREQRYQQIEAFYGADLENGYQWMVANNPSTSLIPQLSGELSLAGAS